jgi:hypothetical protein
MLGVLAERGPVRSVGVNQRLLGRAAYSALVGIVRGSSLRRTPSGRPINRGGTHKCARSSLAQSALPLSRV